MTSNSQTPTAYQTMNMMCIEILLVVSLNTSNGHITISHSKL